MELRKKSYRNLIKIENLKIWSLILLFFYNILFYIIKKKNYKFIIKLYIYLNAFLKLTAYKDTFVLDKTDDIQTILEENLNFIFIIKTSPYIK